MLTTISIILALAAAVGIVIGIGWLAWEYYDVLDKEWD